MDLSIDLCGIRLKSPLIVGSGPISYGAEGMIRAFNHGAGAVVTKTIRDQAADNPFPHIALSDAKSLVNAEKWSDFPARQWIDQEIPRAKAAGVVVIGSIGYTPEAVDHWICDVDRAGADMIELVSYREETIREMVVRAKRLTDKPVFVKISPNWPDAVSAAIDTLRLGVDGITAMDSLGPVLRIDIKTGRPMLGGAHGEGWLSGAAIKPIALSYVAEIAAKTDKPIIGLGGVMNAEDAVEMMMAGASAVGVCSYPIIRGTKALGTLNEKIISLAKKLGFSSLSEISGYSQPYLRSGENSTKFSFSYNPDICTECGRCVTVCPYEARSMVGKQMNLDRSMCRYCGLCVTACPTGALSRSEVTG